MNVMYIDKYVFTATSPIQSNVKYCIQLLIVKFWYLIYVLHLPDVDMNVGVSVILWSLQYKIDPG